MKTIKVQYAKRYYKAVTKDVEVPEDVEDVEAWIHENSLELFEDDITAKSLDFEDDEVHILEDVDIKFIQDWDDAKTVEEKIEKIQGVIQEYGEFTTGDVQAELSPSLESPDGRVYLMEEFEMYGGKVYVYEAQSGCSDAMDKYDADYEDVPEPQLDLILELAKKWVEQHK
jgi:hypothetical protein